MGLTTSWRRAPGWNRTALAKASFEVKAVFRMFMPALICRSISQSHIRHTKSRPTLSRRRAPHTGQVLLVQAGLTLMTGTPARAALYSIWRWTSRREPRGEATVHSTGVAARLKLGEALKDDSHPTFLGERYESFRNGMEPLTYSVMLPPSLPAEQALSDPPVIGLFRRKSPTAGEVNALDLPHSIEGYPDEIHPVPRHDHSVHRILVRVKGNPALRFVCFWRLPPHCDNAFPRNDRSRSAAPQAIRKDRPT